MKLQQQTHRGQADVASHWRHRSSTAYRYIQYNVALITYKALWTSVSPYLDELLQCQETTRSLRSTDALRLQLPRTLTETAKRAFNVAAPRLELTADRYSQHWIIHFS